MLTEKVSLSNNQQTSIEKQDEEYQKLSAQKDDFLNEKRLSEKDLSQKRAELEREYLFFKEEQQSFIKQRENFKIEEAKNLNWLRSEEVSLSVVVRYKMIINRICYTHLLLPNIAISCYRIVLGDLMKN